jgi:hypothetical protein
MGVVMVLARPKTMTAPSNLNYVWSMVHANYPVAELGIVK